MTGTASTFFDKRFQKYNFAFNSPPKEQKKKKKIRSKVCKQVIENLRQSNKLENEAQQWEDYQPGL